MSAAINNSMRLPKRDQSLLAEAYEAIIENFGQIRGDEQSGRKLPNDNKELRDELDARELGMKNMLVRKWTLRDTTALKDTIEKATTSARIHPSALKPGDKKSQDFIYSLAKAELSNNPDLLRQVDADKVLQAYRNEVDPGIQKADDEREVQRQSQALSQRSSRTTGMSQTIKKLEQAGFKRGKSYKDENGVMVVPMSKTIGSLLGGRQDKTVTVNPDGSIFKGEEVDSWLVGTGKHFAKGKKSLF